MKILKNKDQRHDGSIIQSIDPATLDVLDEVRTTPAKDVESIVDRARDAFPPGEIWGSEEESPSCALHSSASWIGPMSSPG